jgi:hypothetical protein
LEDFELFCLAKLNLSMETAKHYFRRVSFFLENRNKITERNIQTYIYEVKRLGFTEKRCIGG